MRGGEQPGIAVVELGAHGSIITGTLGTFTSPAGAFRQTAELTKTQRDLFAKLSIAPPKKIIETTPAPAS